MHKNEKINIIAHIRQHHFGKVENVLKNIDAAKECGAHGVCITLRNSKCHLQREEWYDNRKTEIKSACLGEFFDKLNFLPDELKKISDYCKSNDMLLYFEPWSVEDLELVVKSKLPFDGLFVHPFTMISILTTKIRSFRYFEFIEHYLKFGKKIFLSTAGSNFERIGHLVYNILRNGDDHNLYKYGLVVNDMLEKKAINEISKTIAKFQQIIRHYAYESRSPDFVGVIANISKGAGTVFFNFCDGSDGEHYNKETLKEMIKHINSFSERNVMFGKKDIDDQVNLVETVLRLERSK